MIRLRTGPSEMSEVTEAAIIDGSEGGGAADKGFLLAMVERVFGGFVGELGR